MDLSELEPPENVEADWKPDPLGVGAWRWWNGKNWVAEVAGDPARKKSFWSRLADMPVWARWVLPVIAVIAGFVQYQRFASDPGWDSIWWIIPF